MVRVVLALIISIGLGASAASADRDAWMNPPAAAPQGSPESKFNDGLALAEKKDWRAAEAAFREAVRLKAAFPEAWNGLGHALRNQKRFDESIRSYEEALRLRPAYPQALEYLGEAYIQMGRLDEAKKLVERLRPLDADEADELEGAIQKAAHK